MHLMHKKTRNVLTAFFVLFMFICTMLNMPVIHAAGSNNGIKVFLNGEKLEFDVDPYIKNSRTMVPFRKIFEAFGLKVDWNQEKQTVLAADDDTEITLKINDTRAYVNYIEYKLDAPPEIKNSRTFVPLRFISESVGAVVEWDGKTATVDITYEAGSTQEPVSTAIPGSTGSNTPTPTKGTEYIRPGIYKIGETATYGDLKFSIDKVDLDLKNSVVSAVGKINTKTDLLINIYADSGDLIFVSSRIKDEKEGDMYKFTAYNYFTSKPNIKTIDHIDISIITAEGKKVRVAKYKPS